MKLLKRIMLVTVILLTFFMSSCNTITTSSGKSWFMPENGREKQTIKLAGVSVDRSGGWDSLEKEVSALAPLYFWKHGYRIVSSDDPAAYMAHISLREREYAVGWNTRRSLALEVRVWICCDESSGELPDTLPIAAGRVVTIGSRSFSSSRTTDKMLSRVIGKTAGRLPLMQDAQQ